MTETDLADIFTVARPNIFRKNPETGAETYNPFSRYRCDRKDRGKGRPYFEHGADESLPVKFDFLDNGKRFF